MPNVATWKPFEKHVALPETRWPRRALPWRSRRERLLAHGRSWRLDLRGARCLLHTGQVHHVYMLKVNTESQTMCHKVVLAVAGCNK